MLPPLLLLLLPVLLPLLLYSPAFRIVLVFRSASVLNIFCAEVPLLVSPLLCSSRVLLSCLHFHCSVPGIRYFSFVLFLLFSILCFSLVK